METKTYTGDVAGAAAALAAGRILAVPTETVYGLAANGLDADAVAKVYLAKGRPEQKPLSLLVSGLEQAQTLAKAFPAAAVALCRAFWPGPLTVIVPAAEQIPKIVTAGGDTIGLRCPDHPVTLAIIQAAGVPLAAPSANPSGAPSPKTAQAVLDGLDGKIDGIVDGGPCKVGVESTIVDCTATPPRILRQGGLTRAEIEAVIGQVTV